MTSPDQSQDVEEEKVFSPGPGAPKTEPVTRLENKVEEPKKPAANKETPATVEIEEKVELPVVGKKGGPMGMMLVGVVILLLVAGVTLWLAQEWKQDQDTTTGGGTEPTGGEADPAKTREVWLKEGWKKDATRVLAEFTSAKTAAERLKHVIPNEGVDEEVAMYYGAGQDDADTPVESFSHVDGQTEDHRRGIFLMQYRQPAQIDIREYFAPIGSLEAVMGQEETSLLEMAHRIDEDNLSKPIGVNAFFKEIDGELKLDASVFIQGKYRTFKLFTSYAQPGRSKLFRVVVSESLSHHYRDNPDVRTYRLEDFAYSTDFVSLPVEVESEQGVILSQLNWYGMDRNRIYKTATVELGWTKETPSELKVKRVVCWEFLGVGGEKGNTDPAQ